MADYLGSNAVTLPGTNQDLWQQAAHHDDESTLSPNGNKVQAGALSLINSTSPVGKPNPVNPFGAQTS